MRTNLLIDHLVGLLSLSQPLRHLRPLRSYHAALLPQVLIQLLYPLLEICDDLLVLAVQEDVGLYFPGYFCLLALQVLLVVTYLLVVNLLQMLLHFLELVVPLFLKVML